MSRYEKEIRQLVKEKDRLRRMKEKMALISIDAEMRSKRLIQEAIEKLHEAEMVLRKIE